jgi:hypothetical protein
METIQAFEWLVLKYWGTIGKPGGKRRKQTSTFISVKARLLRPENSVL